MNEYAVDSLYIELTSRCFYKCPYCYFGPDSQSGSSLKLTSIKTLLSQAKELGCTTVVFSGGEPFILKETIQIVQEARELDFHFIEVDTNCYLVNKDIARELKGSVSCVRVNMAFPHREKHEQFTGVSGSFERTMAGIRALLDEGIPVAFQSVVYKENMEALEDILKLARSIDLEKVRSSIDKVTFTGIIPTGRARRMAGILQGSEYELLSKKLERMALRHKVPVGNGLKTKLVREMLRLYPVCAALSHRALSVKPNGNVSVCTWLDSSLTFLGNIKSKSLENIVRRVPLITSRLKLLNDYFIGKYEKELSELVPVLYGRCQKCIEWRSRITLE